MIRLLMCIFGLHGAREIDYTNDHVRYLLFAEVFSLL